MRGQWGVEALVGLTCGAGSSYVACLGGPQGRWMMHAVAARAAASAAAAAAFVASATALASRASTSVRGARLAYSSPHEEA